MIHDDNLQLILTDMLEVHGYDFFSYSKASIKRRIERLYSIDGFVSFAEFRYKLKSDEQYAQRFIEEVTVNVTEMFRDPSFYKMLRTAILPVLATKPFIRIWHAGCSTGEEVYSMAILLHESKLLERSLLYATDINPSVLEVARKGIFPLHHMKQHSENYILSGGKNDFSSYYTANYNGGKFKESLAERMIFSTHNLVSDGSFNEFHLILCRNVLIYFEKDLQNRIFHLFDQSLEKLAYLALGAKESIRFSDINRKFQQVKPEKIWKKVA